MSSDLLLSVRGAGKQFMQGNRLRWACRDVSFELYPGEVLAVVGESGSGKSTLLRLLAARLACDEGSVHYDVRDETGAAGAAPARSEAGLVNLADLSEARLRWLARTDWGFVEQHARDGLRMNVSGGANIGERMMALGSRHYGKLRGQALSWMERVELDVDRIDDLPGTYSGGMQQRLQIARNLVTHPRLVFMDEPTTGLDVSVQARLLDLLRELVDQLQLAAVIVTHDLAVARLLAHRMLVMKDGQVVEQGLTDRVLDDPQHAYTQLLVSSVLTP
ncbi:phosphonate C-P lyase system protein PhnK [Polaromonas sp.]|uniref:phosphonate C-P lyase system protein PhnK n=1 Tax=Polaromonas sp. TaxID=1869339 RepID=UPI003568300E